MWYALRNEFISCIYFKKQTNPWKLNHYFNDSKQRRMKLYCNKKIISIIKSITLNLHGKSSTTKTDEPILCRYLMSTIWTFDCIEKKMMYTEIQSRRLHEKVLWILKRTLNELWKEENDIINKQRIRIIS